MFLVILSNIYQIFSLTFKLQYVHVYFWRNALKPPAFIKLKAFSLPLQLLALLQRYLLILTTAPLLKALEDYKNHILLHLPS